MTQIPTLPRGILMSALNTSFGINAVVGRAAAEYVSGALERRATPAELGADLIDWYATAWRRERPQWATEHKIVAEWPVARLRDFSRPRPRQKETPTLLLPPQAGHDSCIVDYHPDQSQVRTARAAGLTRVLSLDWTGATEQTKDASVEDYLAVISDSVERLGGRVHLVGDCQGGWLGVIYTALHPDTVASLTIAGAPVDFHAGEPLIGDWLRTLAPTSNLLFYKTAVAANGGILPGEFQLAGFMALQPHKELERQLQLLVHINDPAHVARYRTFETWFQHTQPIPGAFYLWIIEHLFQRNELVAGTLEVGGEQVDLARITCPVNLLAGETDHITPPPQVWALAEHVSTDPAQITRQLSPGGHLGLFMGRDSLRDHWTPLFASIAAAEAA